MPDWQDLAATLVSSQYNAQPSDDFYGATGPLVAPACRCDSPWIEHDPDDVEPR